jgi:HPt (histidine-containing phosphotransfer) domain-containing protein
MARTELPQSADKQPAVPDVTYEEVRQSFLVRLHSEQTRLAALTAQLGSAEGNPAPAFANLEGFAHRLRGAAAVFDFPELRDVAKVLELAANAAVIERAPAHEPRVQSAIRTLSARLAQLTGGTPPTKGTVALLPTN